MNNKLQLRLFHGRADPDEDMDDWGFDGPIIRDIVAIHFTYMSDVNVFFASPGACLMAYYATGWERFDDVALNMKFYDGLVRLEHSDNTLEYYGDWEIQPEGT